MIDRAVIVSKPGELCFDLPALGPSAGTEPVSAGAPEAATPAILSDTEMRRRERDNILAALEQTDWRIYGPGGAAELLDIRPTTLASREARRPRSLASFSAMSEARGELERWPVIAVPDAVLARDRRAARTVSTPPRRGIPPPQAGGPHFTPGGSPPGNAQSIFRI